MSGALDEPPPGAAPPAATVLLVDDDQDICDLVEAILSDSGYRVECLTDAGPAATQAAVGRVEPDCVLLDGASHVEYGDAWERARWLTVRGRPVPVVMFTAHSAAVREAQAAESARSRAAGFAGVVAKPFDLEELLAAVAKAVGEAVPFDRSPQADAARTQALVERLRAGGAHDVHRSTRREWVVFRAPSGRLVQLYWWQRRGLYYCGAYDEQSAAMQPLGCFPDLEAAVAHVLGS